MTIRLINGPHDGRMAEYTGERLLRLAIVDQERTIRPVLGVAAYSPNANHTLAFWAGNYWLDGLRGKERFDE